MSLMQKTISLEYGKARVFTNTTRIESGYAGALEAAALIRAAISARGTARVMVGTGNSQLALVDALMEQPAINWNVVEAFHMDEYVGISTAHPASFRRWLKLRVQDRQNLAALHYLDGDASDLSSEIARYTALLYTTPVDVAFVGFGENGHIAFNDPAVANFSDPAAVKIVTLDSTCRSQQVGEGHFKSIADVPSEALTVTCSALLRARAWVCCVPERRKAPAVRAALEGEISTACPASIVREHPHASVYLDDESASLLSVRSSTA